MKSISELQAVSIDETVRFGPVAVQFAYRPGAWEGNLLDKLPELSLYEVMERLLAAWELVDAEGQPIPLVAAEMEHAGVPLALCQLIYERVRETLLPNLRAAASSAST